MQTKTVNIRNVGQYGVISDPNACDIPPNAFSDALNVRFKGTSAELFGGHKPVLSNAKPSGESFNNIMGLDDKTWDYKAWIIGGTSKIWRVDESNWTDYSRDGAVYPETTETWQTARLSNSIIFNRSNVIPQGLTPKAQKFIDLPGWQEFTDVGEDGKKTKVKEFWRANIIRSYKNFLVAFNMSEGVDEANQVRYSQRVRWSNAAENGTLPRDWDDGDAASFASYNDLGNAEGGIVDAAQLRDSMIIYTNKEIHSMTWIGGSQLFAFRRLFADTGMLAPGCVVEFESQHFVIGNNDIFVHDGANKRSIIYGRIERKLMSELRNVNPWATKAFANHSKKEVWVCYVAGGTPSRDSGELPNWFDRAAVWNWQDDTWTFYELPSVRGVSLVPTPSPDNRNWDGYPGDPNNPEATPAGWWENQAEPWNLYDDNFANESILAVSEFNEVFMLDSGDKTYYPEYSGSTATMKSQTILAYMTRIGLDLDTEGAHIREEKELFKVWPQITGDGNIQIEAGGQVTINTPVNFEQAQSYNVAEDYETEFRVAYRYLAFRFTSSTGGDWRFSGYDYEIAIGTRR